jgi:hypothetical protein
MNKNLETVLSGRHYKSIEVLSYQSKLSPLTVKKNLYTLNAEDKIETIWMRVSLNSRPVVGYRMKP